ncbi:MAG: hypothetical protein KA715_09270 [Xanthomonadaceae bacterium]|nr:hypothetical protein [Xanthomonadaceae bacterium]
MKKKIAAWISICCIFMSGFLIKPQEVRADFFGMDIPILINILTQTISQVQAISQMLGKAKETVSILEEMNRGVKEVLNLAETAHISLPPQVYEGAKQIDRAVWEARRVYGEVSERSPKVTQNNYRTGVEGLFLSQDAFDYSNFLDEKGNKVKTAALVASQVSATRLTAETMGVLLHAVSHGNRLEAKQLEISSTKKIQDSTKENAEFESFVETHSLIDRDMKRNGMSSLNSIGGSQ